MLKALLCCFTWGLLPSEALAQKSETWHVVPSTCVVDKSGDICRLELNVTPPKSLVSLPPQGQVCFVLQQQQLHCLPKLQSAMTVPVLFSEPSLFEVIIAEHAIFAKQLDIQTLSPTKQRRRVRSPWSIF